MLRIEIGTAEDIHDLLKNMDMSDRLYGKTMRTAIW